MGRRSFLNVFSDIKKLFKSTLAPTDRAMFNPTFPIKEDAGGPSLDPIQPVCRVVGVEQNVNFQIVLGDEGGQLVRVVGRNQDDLQAPFPPFSHVGLQLQHLIDTGTSP